MSRKFVPDYVNLPTVPGSPSINEEETLEDIETEDTNPNTENFNSEHEVYIEPSSDKKRDLIPESVQNFQNFTPNPPFETSQSAMTVNVLSNSVVSSRPIKNSKSRSKSPSSSLSHVMTPGNVSRESGYITSTQRTEIGGIISPTRTGSQRSETGIRVTHRQPSLETPGSVATTSSRRFRELPQVIFSGSQRKTSRTIEGKIGASATKCRKVFWTFYLHCF